MEAKGCLVQRVKVFEYHANGMKHLKIVHAQHRDISMEFAKTVKELLIKYIASPFDIIKAYLVLGGNHFQGAFRLCSRALVTLEGQAIPANNISDYQL